MAQGRAKFQSGYLDFFFFIDIVSNPKCLFVISKNYERLIDISRDFFVLLSSSSQLDDQAMGLYFAVLIFFTITKEFCMMVGDIFDCSCKHL